MRKPRILIVDDAAYMRAVIEDVLTRNGFEVIGMAKNGLEGVNLYREFYEMQSTPDLILMDITMKKMNGIDALKEIKIIDKNAKVVMCSSVKSKEALVKAVQAGATYFIIKPFENEELIRTVNKALEHK